MTMVGSSLKFWIQATRPKTLIAAFIPVCGAYVLARGQGFQADVSLFFAALGAAVCIQIATNLFNDYFDFKNGGDTEKRLGPKRGLTQGTLTVRQVLSGASLFIVLAFASAWPIFIERGWSLAFLGILCALLAALYTGGPFPLTHLGLGEIFVLIFFGWVATYFSFYVISGERAVEASILGIQLGLLSCVLITVNNLRDEVEDRSTQKNTLVVRFGRNFALKLLLVELFLPYVFLYYWMNLSNFYLMPLLLAPLAIKIYKIMSTEEMSEKTNRVLAMSSLHALGFLLFWSFAALNRGAQ